MLTISMIIILATYIILWQVFFLLITDNIDKIIINHFNYFDD